MAAVLTGKMWQTLLDYSTKTLPCVLRFCSSQAKPSCKASSSQLLSSSKVNSFGKLSIVGGMEAVDLHVKPCSVYSTDWKERQEQVSAYLVSHSQDARRVIEGELNDIVECEVSNESEEHEHSLQSLRSIVNININADNLDSNCRPSLPDASKLLVEVPHFFHLDIKWSASSKITIEKLEGDVRVQAVGDCVLSHLKSPSITVCTTHGSITGKSSLIGDTALTTGKGGDVNIDKLQGNSIKIDCRDGQLRIKSLYGGDTVMSTTSGEIHVGDAHGNVNLSSSSGNVTVESICGLLKAVLSCGDLDAKVTAGGNIDADCSNGNTTIKIDDNLRCDLDLRAKTIDISRDFNILEKNERLLGDLVTVCGQSEGRGEQRVHVNCPKGHLKLLRESWFVLPDM